MTLRESIAVLEKLVLKADEWKGRYLIELQAHRDVLYGETHLSRYTGRDRDVYELAYGEAQQKQELN